MKISHRDTLQTMKSLFEWRMSTILSLQSDKNVTEGQTLEHWTKLMDRLKSIGLGYEKVIGSRTVLVLANGMWHRLKKELKNDDAVLFRLQFLAYLDIGGEHISSVFPCILFVFFLCFLFVIFLAVVSYCSNSLHCIILFLYLGFNFFVVLLLS